MDIVNRERVSAISGRVHRLGDPLSNREVQILRFLRDGYTNTQAASRLDLSVETIKTHVRIIFVKLGALNRTHAVVIAIRKGLIELGE